MKKIGKKVKLSQKLMDQIKVDDPNIYKILLISEFEISDKGKIRNEDGSITKVFDLEVIFDDSKFDNMEFEINEEDDQFWIDNFTMYPELREIPREEVIFL